MKAGGSLNLPFALSAPVAGGVDLLVIAGEHSGDEHGARLVAGSGAAPSHAGSGAATRSSAPTTPLTMSST
jgi:hypothetical protein